ncbi:MAG TPA: MlaD family protein, partial [Nitrolancea sp.]|nr:MlaD family protein [Nitrolancea sp.]
MSEREPPRQAVPATPRIRRRRFSLIWALPIVAGVVAAWLGYTTFIDRGPTITIHFKTASGLEAGKTQIKHHDVSLGVVKSVEPTPDLSEVIVTAEMSKIAAPHLTEGTKFWLVKPRISITSLSGLDTLVSGDYIEMDPGEGHAEKTFTGLEEPPVVRSDVPGTTYILTTDKIGSITSGSPVYMRDMEVGEVIGYTFEGLDKGFTIRAFVEKPYDQFVHDGSTFWNASGINLTTGADGFKLQMESLGAVLAGGIAFDTPEAARSGAPAKADTAFHLYEDQAAANEAGFTQRVRLITEFEGSVRGLTVGAPVELAGIRIGQVVALHLVVDAKAMTIKAPVVIEIEPDRIGIINQPPGQLGQGGLIMGLVKLGLRAQLRTSSLITGQLLVALDFFPNAPPAQITLTDTYPKFPTVPTQLDSLTRSLTQILDKVSALPLDELTTDIRSTLGSARQLLHDADSGTAPLITSLRQTSDAADMVLKSLSASYGQ